MNATKYIQQSYTANTGMNKWDTNANAAMATDIQNVTFFGALRRMFSLLIRLVNLFLLGVGDSIARVIYAKPRQHPDYLSHFSILGQLFKDELGLQERK